MIELLEPTRWRRRSESLTKRFCWTLTARLKRLISDSAVGSCEWTSEKCDAPGDCQCTPRMRVCVYLKHTTLVVQQDYWWMRWNHNRAASLQRCSRRFCRSDLQAAADTQGLDSQHKGSRTRTGSDIILHGHYVQQTGPEKVKKGRDGTRRDGGGWTERAPVLWRILFLCPPPTTRERQTQQDRRLIVQFIQTADKTD